MSPALNGSSALQRFERNNAIEIRNGIMFDFYPGLPHMHIAWVTCISPREMAFRSQVVPYPLFTAKFNGEGGTVQYHLTIKYIQRLIQFYSFWGSVWSCAMISQPFSRAQQFTAVVSVHIMVDFLKIVFFFQQFAIGMTLIMKMTFVSTTESTNKSPNLHIGVINMHDLHFSVWSL